jgi:ABC-type nitrate/sulfonate/bicarbonate transport system permease component
MMRRFKIYSSRWFLLGTFLTILLPFLFFFAFTKYTDIKGLHLLNDFGISLARILIAYTISAVLAWVSAIVFSRGSLSKIALPVFDVLQSFPTFAALPLAVYLWGVSGITVILFLIVTIIWPIFFSIISSLKLVKRDWEEVVKMANLSGWNYFRKFLFPSTIPGLITGSIIGLGEGWEALVATEIIVGVHSGLGSFFHLYSNNAQVTILGILGFLLVIFSINKIIWLPLLEASHRIMEE